MQVRLLQHESPGVQQHATAALAELAAVPRNRDMIANAGGVRKLIGLLTAPTIGTPEVATRALAHLALEDP